MISLRRRIFISFTVALMTVIFLFSAEDATLSSQNSNWAANLIGRLFCDDYENFDENEKIEFIERIDHPVRKAAHFTLYACLGFLMFGAVADKGIRLKKTALLSWCFGTLYAATDEIHQIFVPGRSCQLTDILLDSAGVFCGALFALLTFSACYTLLHRSIIQ
ncbi:MAG: VanZ family protein [Clostridium sp.]|nr:VanZ family protein [Clostridium sp.]MCM1209529.1 VanZ family protein [Ruminococcus sp.]